VWSELFKKLQELIADKSEQEISNILVTQVPPTLFSLSPSLSLSPCSTCPHVSLVFLLFGGTNEGLFEYAELLRYYSGTTLWDPHRQTRCEGLFTFTPTHTHTLSLPHILLTDYDSHIVICSVLSLSHSYCERSICFSCQSSQVSRRWKIYKAHWLQSTTGTSYTLNTHYLTQAIVVWI
jgi:hypothetical protein